MNKLIRNGWFSVSDPSLFYNPKYPQNLIVLNGSESELHEFQGQMELEMTTTLLFVGTIDEILSLPGMGSSPNQE